MPHGQLLRLQSVWIIMLQANPRIPSTANFTLQYLAASSKMNGIVHPASVAQYPVALRWCSEGLAVLR